LARKKVYILPKSLTRRVNREILKNIAKELDGWIVFTHVEKLKMKKEEDFILGKVGIEVDEDKYGLLVKLLKKFNIEIVDEEQATAKYPRRVLIHLLSASEIGIPIGFGANMDRLVLIPWPSRIQTDSIPIASYFSLLSNSVIWLGKREPIPSGEFEDIYSLPINLIPENKLLTLASYIARHTIGIKKRIDILERLKSGSSRLLTDEELELLSVEERALAEFFENNILSRESTVNRIGRYFFSISGLSNIVINALVITSFLIGFDLVVLEGATIMKDVQDILEIPRKFIYVTPIKRFLEPFDAYINYGESTVVKRVYIEGEKFELSEKFIPIWRLFKESDLL